MPNLGVSLGDVIAGITVGILAVPQGLSFAQVAGLPPQYGLYNSLLASVSYAPVGTSPLLIVGPTSVMSLLVKSAVQGSGEEGSALWIASAITLAFLGGAIQVVLGLAGLGVFIRLCSKPVLDGFITATALLMVVNQLPGLLGLHSCNSADLWGDKHAGEACHLQEELASLVHNLPHLHRATCALSACSLLFLFALRLLPRIRTAFGPALEWAAFGPILLVASSLSLFYVLARHYGRDADSQHRVTERHWGVRLTGDVPSGLPRPAWPFEDMDSARRVLGLVPSATVIAVVGFMESMAIATAMQRKTGLGARVGAGRELVALGMSNLVVSLFRGYPVTGSFSRTSVNAACGAKTKLSAVVSSLICAAVLVCLTPALFYLPKFALSAIVLQSVLNLVDVPEAVFLWNTSKREFAAFCTVLVASLTLGFEAGLAGGIVVSWMGAVLHVTLPKVSLLRLLPPGLSSSSAAPAAAAFVDAPSSGAGAADVMLLKLSGNVWFSTSEAVEQALEVARDLFQPSAVVLVLDEAAQVDASGIAALSNMADSVFKSSGLALLVTGLGASTTRALERAREANLHLAETWNFAPLVMGIAADKPPSLLGFRDVDAALEYCADKCKPRSEAAFFGEAAAGLLDDARLRAWRADDGSPETAPNVCRLPSFARGAAGLPFEVVLADQRFVPV